MAIYNVSGTYTFPSPKVKSIRVILKGEGGGKTVLTPPNCGACSKTVSGDGGDTTFLTNVAGGGKSGSTINPSTGSAYAGNYGPGGTFTHSQGELISGQNGIDGGIDTDLTTNIGGSGPGGAGENGDSATQYTETSQHLCSGSAPNSPLNPPGYCPNTCCPASAATCNKAGILVQVGNTASHYCLCFTRSAGTCYGGGGGAGAYLEVEYDANLLTSLNLYNTTTTFTVNEGASNLDNGSIEIIEYYTDIYIKTSQGWQLVKNVYVKADSTNWSASDPTLIGPPPV